MLTYIILRQVIGMKLSGCILKVNNVKSIGYAVESLYKYVDELVIIDSAQPMAPLIL